MLYSPDEGVERIGTPSGVWCLVIALSGPTARHPSTCRSIRRRRIGDSHSCLHCHLCLYPCSHLSPPPWVSSHHHIPLPKPFQTTPNPNHFHISKYLFFTVVDNKLDYTALGATIAATQLQTFLSNSKFQIMPLNKIYGWKKGSDPPYGNRLHTETANVGRSSKEE